MSGMEIDEGMLDRARGCLLGQVAGDNLGGLVEFRGGPEVIARLYPNGVRQMRDGGTWGLMAGQATDDSELALALARSICAKGGYDMESTRRAYRRWLDSGPFDMGTATRFGIEGFPVADSLPSSWRETIRACRPGPSEPRTTQPRPEEYWPCDVEELAQALVATGLGAHVSGPVGILR